MLCWQLLMASERCERLMQGQELNLYIYDPFGFQAPPYSMTLLPPYLYMYIPVFLFFMSGLHKYNTHKHGCTYEHTHTHTHKHTHPVGLCVVDVGQVSPILRVDLSTRFPSARSNNVSDLCLQVVEYSIKVCLFAVYVLAVFSYFDPGLRGVWSTGTKRLSRCGKMWSI